MKTSQPVMDKNKPVLFFEEVYREVEKIEETKKWGSIQKSDCTNYVIDRALDKLFRKDVAMFVGYFIQDEVKRERCHYCKSEIDLVDVKGYKVCQNCMQEGEK